MNQQVKAFEFLSDQECDQVRQYAFKIEQQLKDIDQPADEFIITNHYYKYNFFADHPDLADRFAEVLSHTYKHLEWPIIVQSWVNIYRDGQGIKWHNHNGHSGFSLAANIFVDGDCSPGITYQDFNKDPLQSKTRKE